MPSVDPDRYKLVPVTAQHLIDYTRHQNAAAWKGVLSTSDYVLREALLGRCQMTSQLHVYVLYDAGDSQEPLCSVEVLVRDAVRYEKLGDLVVLKPIKCGCIGGVFTYPQHRGQGLAKIMIDKVMELGNSELVGPDGFIFLYSEVGEFYTRCGFKSFAVDIVEMPVDLVLDPKWFSSTSDLINVPEGILQPVKFDEFGPLVDQYKKQDEQEIIAKVGNDAKPRVTLDLSSNQIDWFHLRAKYIHFKLSEYEQGESSKNIDFMNDDYSHLITKLKQIEPHVYGLKLCNENGSLLGYIAWTYDWKSLQHGYATVLNVYVNKSLVTGDPVQMKLKLIEYLQDYLRLILNGCRYEKLVIWSCELPGVDLETIGIVKENPSRSAIQMNSQEDHEMLVNGDLVWENNNKLPWF